MNLEERRITSDSVPLTTLERAYELLGPWVFRAAHRWEYMTGSSSEDLKSRKGLVPAAGDAAVWFHGASAGEISAATALDEMLHERGFRFSAVYTAANRAGLEYLHKSTPGGVIAGLATWDTRETLSRTFARWRPRMLFLVETELWPRLIYEAWIRDIPVFSVSARIYARDIRRYRAIKPFFIPTLRRLTRIIAQDDIEREHFQAIGAPENSCFNGGNLKYLNAPHGPGLDTIAGELGIRPGEPLIVAGSLHRDEIRTVMMALRRLKTPGLRIIIAPRQLSSAAFVAAEGLRLGWRVRRRSDPGSGDWELLVADSMGELKRFYAIATCAIVGGGFGRHGGHNPFEPVIAGTPVVFGPHFENFQVEARALAAATPEARIDSMDHIEQLLTHWLDDDSYRNEALARQRGAVPDGKAIADRYLEALDPWLSAIRA